VNGLGVERKLATLILFVWLNILCYTLLWRHVRVGLAVISLIASRLWIFKHCNVKYFTWKYQTILHFLCSCSYLFTFLLSSQFYWHIRLKSTAYFFDPPCTFINHEGSTVVSAFWAFLSSRHSSAVYCFYCIISVSINKILIHSFIHSFLSLSVPFPSLSSFLPWELGSPRYS